MIHLLIALKGAKEGVDYETIESDVDKAVSKTESRDKSHADSTQPTRKFLTFRLLKSQLYHEASIQSFLVSHNIRCAKL